MSDEDTLSEELLLLVRMTVGKRIRQTRIDLGLSQRAIASDAGVHQTDWSRIERGLIDPRLSTLLRIQHSLGLEGLEILFGSLPSRRFVEESATDNAS